MSLLCLIGIHSDDGSYVRFTEPLKAGKFDIEHKVVFVKSCSRCGRDKVTETKLLVCDDFNLIPRKEIDPNKNEQIRKLLINSNLGVKEIAQETGVSVSTVRRRGYEITHR